MLSCSFAQTTRLTFRQKADIATNPLTKKICTLIEQKKTNLVVAADVTTKAELLDLAHKVGPYICGLKVHIDIIQDFDWDLIVQLKQLAHQHNFIIIEDRKFADIGSTVQAQYSGGIYHYIQWADLIIVHGIGGQESLAALEELAKDYGLDQRGALLIAQLSCKGNLIDDTYTNNVLDMAKRSNFVVGVVAQKSYNIPELLTCTPGVSIAQKQDNLGQQYNSPEYVIQQKGSDLIIVGRAIYQALEPQKIASQYRNIAWQAYLDGLAASK